MASPAVPVEKLTAEERVELMGQLWDSLDAAVAAPLTDALAAELERREAEADQEPEAGDPWRTIRSSLARKLR